MYLNTNSNQGGNNMNIVPNNLQNGVHNAWEPQNVWGKVLAPVGPPPFGQPPQFIPYPTSEQQIGTNSWPMPFVPLQEDFPPVRQTMPQIQRQTQETVTESTTRPHVIDLTEQHSDDKKKVDELNQKDLTRAIYDLTGVVEQLCLHIAGMTGNYSQSGEESDKDGVKLIGATAAEPAEPNQEVKASDGSARQKENLQRYGSKLKAIRSSLNPLLSNPNPNPLSEEITNVKGNNVATGQSGEAEAPPPPPPPQQERQSQGKEMKQAQAQTGVVTGPNWVQSRSSANNSPLMADIQAQLKYNGRVTFSEQGLNKLIEYVTSGQPLNNQLWLGRETTTNSFPCLQENRQFLQRTCQNQAGTSQLSASICPNNCHGPTMAPLIHHPHQPQPPVVKTTSITPGSTLTETPPSAATTTHPASLPLTATQNASTTTITWASASTVIPKDLPPQTKASSIPRRQTATGIPSASSTKGLLEAKAQAPPPTNNGKADTKGRK